MPPFCFRRVNDELLDLLARVYFEELKGDVVIEPI